MRAASIVLVCAVGALVTADHVAATAFHGAKSDRLTPAASTSHVAPSSLITVRSQENTTVIVRTPAPAQMARDMARQPAHPVSNSPAAKDQSSRAPKRLPQACEQSVSPLAANTTFGARCVT
jgi:hypothetical protein